MIRGCNKRAYCGQSAEIKPYLEKKNMEENKRQTNIYDARINFCPSIAHYHHKSFDAMFCVVIKVRDNVDILMQMESRHRFLIVPR